MAGVKRLPLVRVTWTDAHSEDTQYSVTSQDLEGEHRPLEVVTVGFLWRDDEHGVTVFGEHIPENNNYRGRTFIPRGMVVKVAVIEGRKKRAVAVEGGPSVCQEHRT